MDASCDFNYPIDSETADNCLLVSLGCGLIDLIVDSHNESEIFEIDDCEFINNHINTNSNKQYKTESVISLLSHIKNRNEINNKSEKDFLNNIIKSNISKTQLGGCTTNTTRLFTYLLNNNNTNSNNLNINKPFKSLFICSLGDDQVSSSYKDKLLKDDIICLNNKNPNTMMSFCLPIIKNKEKYFINEIEIAKKISKNFIERAIETVLSVFYNQDKEKIEKNDNRKKHFFFLTDSYLIENNYESYCLLMDYFSNKCNALCVYNIGDVYFYSNNKKKINSVIEKYADVVIMNEDELNIIYKSYWNESVEDEEKMKLFLSGLFTYKNSNHDNKSNNSKDKNDSEDSLKINVNYKHNIKDKFIIVTRGKKDTWLIRYSNDKEENINSNARINFYSNSPILIEEEEIVDYNGAGDSFTAGFMYSYYTIKSYLNNNEININDSKNREILDFLYSKSLEFGNFCASEVIKLKGFQIFNNNDVILLKQKEIITKLIELLENNKNRVI